ncbi:hypothetical protein quinque_003333 [Culex quinquefasciatus]
MSHVRTRENTFKVILSNFPKRPKFEEIHKFIHANLALTPDQVKRLQSSHAENCAYVKCSELKIAQETVAKHNGQHVIESNNAKVKVRLVMVDGGVEVKLHDLSENVTNEEIVAFLQHYGDVLSIKETSWGSNYTFHGVSSGIRVAKMILRRHIKSFVTIQNESTLISYKNQPETCRHCTLIQHIGMSYASVVNSGSSTNTLQIKVVPDNPKIESLSNSESVAKAIVIGNSAQTTVVPSELGTSSSILNISPPAGTEGATVQALRKDADAAGSSALIGRTDDDEMPIAVFTATSSVDGTFKVPHPFLEPKPHQPMDASSGSDSDHSGSSESKKRKPGRSKKPKLDK